MNTVLKQRLAGAIFILSLGVILIPVILEKPVEQASPQYTEIPAAPKLVKNKEVNKINYVFNQVEKNFEAQSEQLAATVEPIQDTPVAPAAAVLAEAEPVAEASPAPQQSRLTGQQVVSEAQARELDPGEWTVQLGAFGSRENADGLLSKLTEEGFQSYLKEVPGRDLVRVFVAPGVDHDDAEALVTELNNEMGLKGIIVRFRD